MHLTNNSVFCFFNTLMTCLAPFRADFRWPNPQFPSIFNLDQPSWTINWLSNIDRSPFSTTLKHDQPLSTETNPIFTNITVDQPHQLQPSSAWPHASAAGHPADVLKLWRPPGPEEVWCHQVILITRMMIWVCAKIR